jgi:hypothetical protein
MLKQITCFSLTVVVITIAFCFVALSEPNSQQTITQGKGGKLAAQKSSNQKNQSSDLVTSQILVDAISHAIDTYAQKAKTTQNPTPPDNSSWWFSFFLMIFTGVLAIVAIFQGFILRRTLAETKKAADAANSSATLQKAAMISTQRAFLFLKAIRTTTSIDSATNTPIQFVIVPVCWNSGTTPAMNVSAVRKHQFFDSTIQDEQITIDIPPLTEKERQITFIGPNTGGSTAPIIISKDEAISIFNKTKRLFVRIIFEYKDMFDETPLHHTNLFYESIMVYDPTVPIIGNTPDYFGHIPFWKYNNAD